MRCRPPLSSVCSSIRVASAAAAAAAAADATYRTGTVLTRQLSVQHHMSLMRAQQFRVCRCEPRSSSCSCEAHLLGLDLCLAPQLGLLLGDALRLVRGVLRRAAQLLLQLRDPRLRRLPRRLLLLPCADRMGMTSWINDGCSTQGCILPGRSAQLSDAM